MGDSGDENEPLGVVDGVHDPVVTDAYAVVVSTGELDDSGRTRRVGESVDRVSHPIAKRPLQTAILTSRSRMESYLVRCVPIVVYSRTSAHGTAASRSPRAWSAAKLSSRNSRRSSKSA
jgi:hypothetical protein